MSARRLLISCSLAIPALLLPLASCNDSSRTPAEPNTPNAPAPKIAPNARVAVGPRVNVAGKLGALSGSAGLTTLTGPVAPHDPTPVGVLLKCFNGTDVGPPFPGIYGGTAKRFVNNRGCEVNTFSDDPDGSVAGAFPASRAPYIGKQLTAINHLDFYYAGGPQIGGAPRLNIPIDECESVLPPTAAISTTNTAGCPPGTATDGFFDGTAFIDQSNCNDGDPYVGKLRGEDDPTCNVNYKGVDYPNWTAFETQVFVADDPLTIGVDESRPNTAGWRIARKYDAITSGTGKIEPADILIFFDQQAHFLIYRARFD